MPPVFPAMPSDVRGYAAGVSGYAAGCEAGLRPAVQLKMG
jgi:hypothetical protein